MANPNPSTPVKVPSAAANYTPATLDPDLRSQVNTVLWKDGHVAKIQDQLLHALNANSHNWPTLVQAHALSLLRSGEVTNFPALLRRVLDDVRHDNPPSSFASGASSTTASQQQPSQQSSAGTTGTSTAATPTSTANTANTAATSTGTPARGEVGVNGSGGGNNNKVNGDAGRRGEQSQVASPGLAIPPAVVAEALKVTRETLEAVCEIDENGAA